MEPATIGLLIIAIRFVLRVLLAVSGHVSVDPDESEEFGSNSSSAAESKA